MRERLKTVLQRIDGTGSQSRATELARRVTAILAVAGSMMTLAKSSVNFYVGKKNSVYSFTLQTKNRQKNHDEFNKWGNSLGGLRHPNF